LEVEAGRHGRVVGPVFVAGRPARPPSNGVLAGVATEW